MQVRPDLDQTLPPRPYLPPMHGPLPPKPAYTELDVLGPAFQAGIMSAGMGLFMSSVRNSLDKHNKGAMGVFTRTGWMIGWLGAAGFTFGIVRNSVANMRQSTEDGWSGAAAGCASGFVLGIKNGSIASAMATCGMVGAAMATFDLAGGQIGFETARKPRYQKEKERIEWFRKGTVPGTSTDQEE